MGNYKENKLNKSLGTLRKAKKTKPRSPDLVGRITLQRELVEIFSRQLRKSEDDELTACIAGWKYHDEDGAFISVELSPQYVSRKPTKRDDEDNPFSIFDDEDEDESA